MIRNAFTATSEGIITHYEPTFRDDPETNLFRHWLERDTASQGGTICLSTTITIDALLSLHQIITGELTARTQTENQTP